MHTRPTGAALIDATLGGLAPGLPLVVAGMSGTGRTVIALQLAAEALASGEHVVYVTSEPPILLLHESSALGFELEESVRSGQLVILEFEDHAPALLRTRGAGAFHEELTKAARDASLLVIDKLTSVTTELTEESQMRALLRGLLQPAPDARIVITADEDELSHPFALRRVLLDTCGAYLKLMRDSAGERTLLVEKSRTSDPAGHPIPFRIGHGGAIPLEEKQDRRSPLAVESAIACEGPDVMERSKLLVIEPDDRSSARYVEWLSERYEVIEAADSTGALSVFLGDRPDLVVIALDAEDSTGYEVLRALGSAAEWIPILVLNRGGGRPAERIRPLVLGAADVVAKPVDRFELLHKIDTLLQLPEPPPHTLDVSNLIAKQPGRTRVLSTADFRFRLERVRELSHRIGLGSSLLVIETDRGDVMDTLVEAAEETLRSEDAIHLLTECCALMLLVGTAPDRSKFALRRLADRMADAPGTVRGEHVGLEHVGEPDSWLTLAKAPQPWRELTTG